jgi:hypothetical protein
MSLCRKQNVILTIHYHKVSYIHLLTVVYSIITQFAENEEVNQRKVSR